MSNHFHLLCQVPAPKVLSERELLDHIEAGFGPGRRQRLNWSWRDWRKSRKGPARSRHSSSPPVPLCAREFAYQSQAAGLVEPGSDLFDERDEP
jgi:hypothetical protein